MRLKSYSGPTMAAAMAAVRDELGENAIIIATHEETSGGIRVTAALDDSPDPADGIGNAPAMSAGLSAPSAEDVVDEVYQAFRSHGMPALIGEPLLEAIGAFETSDPVTALAAALRQSFRFAPIGDAPWLRPMMVVGPPGAGKTQTVAKLAARAVMSGRRVAVLTTDTERTGGVAHLSAFVDALRLDLAVVDQPETVSDALLATTDHDLVLIDSAGRNHLDEAQMASLSDLLLGGRIEPILVMPAGVDAVEAGDVAKAFREVGARRLIATRLDMARRLGSVLAAAYAADLAFADFGTTPRIKDGLEPANPRALARLLMPHWSVEERGQQTGT